MIQWPEDIAAGAGDYLQSVINRQTDAYDIFVGLVGDRLGTPTPRAHSGTEEEFDRAIEMLRSGRRVEVLLFLSNRSTPISAIDPYQLLLVYYFKQKAERLGVLGHSYSNSTQFRQLFRKSLETAYSRACQLKVAAAAASFTTQELTETLSLEDVVLKARLFNPQWADYYMIPSIPTRHRRITVTGLLQVTSPYFRFGLKYGDAREPVMSAGGIQTFGQNMLVHLGKNIGSAEWFLTSYQSGIRVGPNVPLPDLDVTRPVAFSFEADPDGLVSIRLNGLVAVEKFFAIDGIPRLLMMAWGDEHDFECRVTDFRLTTQ